MAYGHIGASYPKESVQRQAWIDAGVENISEQSGNVTDVWIDRDTRNQSKAQRWAHRDAMVLRMQREDLPVRLVVTHLHLLGARVDDIVKVLTAIAKPGNQLTVTSLDKTFDLSNDTAPELALRIAEAPSEKARAKAASMRERRKRKTPRALTPAQEAEVVQRRAAGETLAVLAKKYDVSEMTILRTIKRAQST